MSEVKLSHNQGLGLYATKTYKPGDLILEESPLFTFRPNSKDQWSKIKSQFKTSSLLKSYQTDSSVSKKKSGAASSSDFQSIEEFLTIPPSIDKYKQSKFVGLVTAAATYAIKKEDNDNVDSTKEKLLSLYKPRHQKRSNHNNGTTNEENYNNNNNHEDDIAQLAAQAISFIQENTTVETPLYELSNSKEEECLDIMLIWACNAFKGGHVYEVMSRINHSCDFNAVVVQNASVSDKQCVKATSLVQLGDEIHISYLGSYTWAGMSYRQKILRNDKYFDCQCTRCTMEVLNGDVASSVPCMNCHERVNGRYLNEDVQYDDDDEIKVYYASPHGKDKDYVCQKCGDGKGFTLSSTLDAAMEKTVDRVIDHLSLCENIMNENGSDNDDDGNTINDELAEMTDRMICLSYSVLGSKHYCTNLLLVQALGRLI